MMTDQPSVLWKLRRDDHEVSCQVRLMPYGIEVDIVRGNKVALTRTFETDEEALGWARDKRLTREAEGWIAVPLESGPAHTRVV